MGSKSTIWILGVIGGILVYLWYKKSAAAAMVPGPRQCTRLVRKPIGAKQNPLLCTILKLLSTKKCSSPKSGGGGGGGAPPSHSQGGGPAMGARTCGKPVSPCCYCPCVPGSLPLAPACSVGAQLNGLCAPACPQCGIAGCCNLVVAAQCCQRVQSSVYGCCGGSPTCGAGSVGGCFGCTCSGWQATPCAGGCGSSGLGSSTCNIGWCSSW